MWDSSIADRECIEIPKDYPVGGIQEVSWGRGKIVNKSRA
jgi:hypothetical protein